MAARAASTEAALFYVGLTRARDIVYVSHADRDDSGRKLGVSPFVDRIGRNCDFAEFKR